MTEQQKIQTRLIAEACTTMTALLEKHRSKAYLRREPSDEEIAKNDV